MSWGSGGAPVDVTLRRQIAGVFQITVPPTYADNTAALAGGFIKFCQSKNSSESSSPAVVNKNSSDNNNNCSKIACNSNPTVLVYVSPTAGCLFIRQDLANNLTSLGQNAVSLGQNAVKLGENGVKLGECIVKDGTLTKIGVLILIYQLLDIIARMIMSSYSKYNIY